MQQRLFRSPHWIARGIVHFIRSVGRRSRTLLALLFGATALAIYGLVVAALTPLTGLLQQAEAHVRWARVAAEQTNEVLILIAPFQYSGVQDGGEYRRAGEQIERIFAKYADKLRIRVRVEYIPWALADSDSMAQAEQSGARKNATIVIWGDIGPLRNEVRVLNRLYGKQHVTWSTPSDATRRIDEYQRTDGTDRSGYAEFANHDLGNGLAFLAHLAVADILYFQQETDLVYALYAKAAPFIGKGHEDFVAHGIAGVIERMMAIRNVTQDAATGVELLGLVQAFGALGAAGSDLRYEIAAFDAQRHAGIPGAQKALGRIDEILDDLEVGSSTVLAVDARMLRAELLEDLGQTADATEERTRVAGLLQDLAQRQFDYGVIVRLIEANTQLGRHDAAHALIRSAEQNEDVKRSAFWTWTFAMLEVDVHLKQHRYPDAVHAAERAIASSRTEEYRLAAMRIAVQTYMGIGDAPAATSMLGKITDSPRGSSWDFNNLGVLHLIAGECREALAAYDRALERHDFLAARMGRLQSWVCLSDAEAIAGEKKRVAATRERLTKLDLHTNDEAGAALFEAEIDAADAYYQHREWPRRAFTRPERDALVAFALGACNASHDPRFVSWMLRALIDAGQRDESILSALAAIERTGTADTSPLVEVAGLE